MTDMPSINKRLRKGLSRVPRAGIILARSVFWIPVFLVTGFLAGEIAGANLPPMTPILVEPEDRATTVSTSPTLEVSISDPDTENLTVTFYGREAPTAPGPDFTLIGIPDTQYYSSNWRGGSPAIFVSQTQWIVDNVVPLNVAYTIQLGDCVQEGDNNGNPTEWQHAEAAMSLLENTCTTGLPDGVPYGVCVGNHDQSPNGDPDGTTIFYNRFFGIARFQDRPYYGGHFGFNNDNWYELFSASGLNFIVIGLEYDTSPASEVLAWASQLLTTHSNRRAIIASHSFLKPGDPGSFTSQGHATYEALKHHSNLFLMLCGHLPGEGRRQDTFNGNTVHTVLADYQVRAAGGNGWLRIMEFSPSSNVIRFQTYSPWLDRFETDSSSQFDLDYDMQSGGTFQVIGRVVDASSGSASIMWPDLSPGTEYEWYATVSDGLDSIDGPIWALTTVAVNEAPPVVSVASPNGGEVLVGAIPRDITWSVTETRGVTEVDLALSLNGGCTWSPIASGVPNSGIYHWTVPTTASITARVRVTAHDEVTSAGRGMSDSDFEIRLITSSTVHPTVPGLALSPPAPNPFSQRSTIGFAVPSAGHVRITIFDVTGRRIMTLVDEVYEPGRHSLTWNARMADGRRARPGLYFLRLEADGKEMTRKLILTP